MKINLSERLKLIASFIPDNCYMIDVGCDHALLDIYLFKTKQNIKIIASDINEKPLHSAYLNIKKYNLEDKIEILLNDGIKDLKPEVDTVVISGMGGILISEILDKKYLKNVKNIVLSPNNDFSIVRKKIKKIGFQIEKEELLSEKKITYLVIKAKRGNVRVKDNFFGTLNNNNLETIYYYTKLLNTNTKILKQLPKKYIFKRLKMKYENYKIKNFLNKKKK